MNLVTNNIIENTDMKIKTLSVLFAAFLMLSCKKEQNIIEDIKNLDELVIPDNFGWKTSRDVNFNIGISDARFGNKIHVISIFIGDPAKGGSLVSKGAASLISPFNTKIALASTVAEVYILKSVEGTQTVNKIQVGSANVSLSLSETGIIGTVSSAGSFAASKFKAALVSATPELAPACPGPGAGVVMINSNPGDNYVFNSGTTYVVGSNVTFSNLSDPSGGTIYICGTKVEFNGLKIKNNLNVIVTSGGSATFNNMNWEGNGVFKNFGTINGNLGNVKVMGTFYNKPSSVLAVNGFSLESGTTTNFGEITVSGNTQVSNSASFINEGTFTTNGFAVQNGTSKVTSTGTITVNNNLDNAGTFNTAGTLTVKGNLNSNSGTPTFVNSGTINLQDNSTFLGSFTNTGNLEVSSGEINLNDSQSIINSGTITALKSKMNISGTVTNNGSVTIKELNNTGSGKLINNCKIWVTTNFNNDNQIENYSYIQVDNESNLKGTFNLHNGAMFSTKFLVAADGIVEAKGADTSLVKVLTSSNSGVDANGSGKFRGLLQYCDSSRTIRTSQFINGAKQACGVYISKTSCNTAGNGTAPVSDKDGDGIPDNLDDYPNDPEKAFNNYSINYNGGGSAVAFEDSWPLKGDYDLNDVVITFRYLLVTDHSNKVVQIKADYDLHATGGTFNNGAGIQFNIPAVKAKNFSGPEGTYLESNQDSVVLILFTNSRAEQENWNTYLSQPVSPVKSFNISFDIEDGPTLASLGLNAYNPFIWNNSPGYGRGYETHLYGKKPTKLANLSLFGTGDDNSVSGANYSTVNKLPWAIELPTAPFIYPIEKTSITKSYLKFASWASSGGSVNMDWYINTSEGYRDISKLYIR